MEPETGRLLLINKPYDWTSFDVVNKLRYRLKIKKIGHAGTLDPLATGLLIICTGKMTKRIEEFMGLEKEYTGKMILGKTTPSHDMETQVNRTTDISSLKEHQVREATHAFTGKLSQLPPMHSAIKVGGKRAYEFARQGRDIVLQPREVEVKVFELMNIHLPEVSFRIICSKGTYIRSIVRDFGESLGAGAYLSELCRTRIGPYLLSDAITIEEVTP